jgi:hypothetical protein
MLLQKADFHIHLRVGGKKEKKTQFCMQANFTLLALKYSYSFLTD